MLMEGRKLHVFEKLEAYTKRYFKNDRLRKKLEYSMVFLGGAPKNTPALYSLMSHVDFNLGVWYPMGGMGVVTQALEKLARDLGVEFKFETEVTKIVSENGNVSEVQTNKGNFKADVVVFNGDYHYAETTLLAKADQTYKQSYWDKRTVAPSGFIMFLGLNKKIKNLEHHTLFFDNDWQEHFDGIFEHPEWPEKPSYYVCAPSKTDPSVAPEGKEAVFILVPVAAGLEDSDELRESYAKKIITHLEELVGESIEDAVDVKRIYTQRDFYADYFAFKGTALGLSHTLLQTAIFRPHHRSKKVQNLFYTGQYTHPGIGMPMTLISSQIVAEQIKKIYG
jgi:phytoene desaturase